MSTTAELWCFICGITFFLVSMSLLNMDLYQYANEKSIYMKINYVNSDHVHVLIDLPTSKTIEDILHLLKGSSSNWINKQVNFKFSWSKGYAVFSVSESNLDRVVKYIANQDEHHRKKSYLEEYEMFLQKHKISVNG